MRKMNKLGDLTEEEEFYRDSTKKPRNFDIMMRRSKSSNYSVPQTKKVVRADKPGRRCVAWSRDTSWLVFVDTKYHKCYHFDQCFIWNRHTHVKLDLPNLDHNSFLKCVLYCSEIQTGTWEFKIVFCLKNECSYIWSSPGCQDWQRGVHFSWLPTDARRAQFRFSDAVSFDHSYKNGQRKKLCYITRNGILVTETTTGWTFKQVPNPDIITYERKLVNYCETTLFLLQRKGQSAWEVWKMDLSREIWENLSSFNSKERLVFFTSRGHSAAYPRSEKLHQNCVCYTEEGDHDNIYVFWLADQSLSVFKNQPNSGFPYWFPDTTHSGIPWLSFLEDENVIIISDEAYKTPPRCLDESYCRDSICCELIPRDIWSFIAESLDNVADYASFRGVCKTWREITHPICWKPGDVHQFSSSIRPVKLFPWLITRLDINLDHDNDSWSFLDPTCNMRYYININELSGCEIQYSKDGWLLVTRDTRTMFFFEPFSKTKINLVDIPELFSSNDGMSFSSSPISPDWIIFVQQHTRRDLLCSAYLRSGDEGWNIIDHDLTEVKHNYICSSSSPLFHDHKFYSLGRDGSLFIIDLNDHSLEIVPNVDNIGSNETIVSGSGYLVSCENEVYRVLVGSLGRFIRIYKLIDDDTDELDDIWDEVKSVNDYAIFVSEKSSFAIPVTVNAHKNSINFPLLAENCCLSYKLDVCELKSFDGDSVDPGIYGRKELFGGTWIQPKVVRAYR